MSRSYELYLHDILKASERIEITIDGRDEKLMEISSKAEYALFIEQEIEAFLGIEDRPVRGEYR